MFQTSRLILVAAAICAVMNDRCIGASLSIHDRGVGVQATPTVPTPPIQDEATARRKAAEQVAQGRPDRAVSVLRVWREHPESSVALLGDFAAAALASRRFDLARQALLDALAKKGGDEVRITLGLVEVAHQSGDDAEVIARAQRYRELTAAAATPEAFRVDWLTIDAMQSLRRYSDALALIDRLERQAKGSSRVSLARARAAILFESLRFKESLEVADAALAAAERTDPRLHEIAAGAALKCGLHEKARDHYRVAITANPGRRSLDLALATTLVGIGGIESLEEAEALVRRCVDHPALRSRSLRLRELILRRLGRIEEAAAAAEACDLATAQTQVHEARARDANDAIHSGRETPQTWLTLIDARLHLGGPAVAADDARRFVAAFPQHVEGRGVYCDLLVRCGRANDAWWEAIRFAEDFPDHVDAVVSLAWAAEASSRHAEARQFAEDADRLKSADPRVLHVLEAAYRRGGAADAERLRDVRERRRLVEQADVER